MPSRAREAGARLGMQMSAFRIPSIEHRSCADPSPSERWKGSDAVRGAGIRGPITT